MSDFNQLVLIIDDSEIDRYILKRQLISIGFQTVHDVDGPQRALEYIELAEQGKNAVPALLIVDMHMPTCSGLEFLTGLSERFDSGSLRGSKVLMYSASENPSEQAELLQLPMVAGFIAKGAELAVITKTVNSVVDGSTG